MVHCPQSTNFGMCLTTILHDLNEHNIYIYIYRSLLKVFPINVTQNFTLLTVTVALGISTEIILPSECSHITISGPLIMGFSTLISS